MKFARLRLAGFKSFVDPAEVAIDAGMTGIVGPNGCGKSNLVEALRWAMGENSARRMRGQEMDDVIFGGTSGRAARSVAEVRLTLDNTERTAPGVGDVDTIEVSRRIERGLGSDFRINGRPVRARDVQLLFQDNASGPNSPGLVSQGRVASLISAKAPDRRAILEEAAGTTGLHARRHEAELRLRSAEENLSRLDETLAQIDTQLSSLRRQARQAQRYRDLAARIRTTEAVLLHLRWIAALEALAAARARHQDNERIVAERMIAAGRAATEQAEAAATLPPLRREDAETAAALQALLVERDGLEAEAARLTAATTDTRRRLEQVEGDLVRERALAIDAAQALERLREERTRIQAQSEGEAAGEAEAQAAIATRRATVETLDAEAVRLTEETAAAEARRQAIAKRLSDLDGRAASLGQRVAEAVRQANAAAQAPAGPTLSSLAAAEAEASARFDAARQEVEAADAARQAADAGQVVARDADQRADSAAARLRAEAEGLRAALGGGRDGRRAGGLIDAVTVVPGAEAAFGAALGDDASIPVAATGALRWEALPGYAPAPALPDGVEPLGPRVTAPAALDRRLALTGIAADARQAAALQPALQPGQVLVTADGGAWRWDGVVTAPGAPSPAAARLSQRNRLAALETDLAAAQETARMARAAFDAARRAATETQTRERQARQAQQAAFADAGRAREAHARAAQAEAQRRARIETAEAAVARLREDLASVEEDRAAARAESAALPPLDDRRRAVVEARAAVAEARTALNHAQTRLERLQRESLGRRNRLRTIESEATGWESRARGSTERMTELEARVAETRTALDALLGRPAEIAAKRSALLDTLVEAEQRRRRAADALAGAERRQGDADRALRAAESALSEAREVRARAEGEVHAAIAARDAMAARIAERLDTTPDRTAQLGGLVPGAPLPDAAATEAALDRLMRDRDAIGPVNLRAETEIAELEGSAATLVREKEDLTAAIAKLRQAITALNREARERLTASFGAVDNHFRTLFTRLFGGGRAHLELTDTEDPLAAGLEIYASPPGKKLQHLSLLSGGEQALTALSLIFAVFLTNPAPICVLDEVDAPLDDANVDRLCSLLTELAADGRTRFLIITHHRMTMARVDRLYGVTMIERGVSQLVSVDLEQAARHAQPHQAELAL